MRSTRHCDVLDHISLRETRHIQTASCQLVLKATGCTLLGACAPQAHECQRREGNGREYLGHPLQGGKEPHRAPSHRHQRDPQWRQGQEWGDARRERIGSQCRAVSVPAHGSCSPPTNRAARDDCAARPGSRLLSHREPVSDVVVVLVSPPDSHTSCLIRGGVQLGDVFRLVLHKLAQQIVVIHIHQLPARQRTA